MNRSRMLSKLNCQMNSNGTELCVNAGMVSKDTQGMGNRA